MITYDRDYKNPHPTKISQRHWEGAKEGRLMLLRCQDCGQYVHFPSYVCDECLSENLDWAQLSGLGTVETFTVVHRAFSPEFEKDVPYTAAIVRLDEGPKMLTWLTETGAEGPSFGQRVEVTFERISDEINLHRFRPARQP